MSHNLKPIFIQSSRQICSEKQKDDDDYPDENQQRQLIVIGCQPRHFSAVALRYISQTATQAKSDSFRKQNIYKELRQYTKANMIFHKCQIKYLTINKKFKSFSSEKAEKAERQFDPSSFIISRGESKSNFTLILPVAIFPKRFFRFSIKQP